MTKKEMLQFLYDLSENNSKEWMDENRSYYHAAKDRWIEEVQLVLHRLEQYQPELAVVKPKETLSRINNNRRFHPDKPVYKDFFSCEIGARGKVDSLFYFAVGKSWSFVGGGLYHPPKEQLQAFREAIDYNGEEFRKLTKAKTFKDFYGGLSEYEDTLKTAPRDFDVDHPHIDFLRLKSITATRDLTKKEMISDGFVDLIEEAYLAFRPMEKYVLQALTMVEGE